MLKTLAVGCTVFLVLCGCEEGWPSYPNGRRSANLNCAPTGSRISQSSTVCANSGAGGVTTQQDIDRAGRDVSQGTSAKFNSPPPRS